MQNDNGSYSSTSDLLDSHALGNDKLGVPTMERSTRSSLDVNSVEIGEITESPDTEYMSTSAILHYCKSKALFENPDFEVDKKADEYRLLNPVLSRLDRSKEKPKTEIQQMETEDTEDKDSDRELYETSSDSSDDERTWAKEVKKQHKIIRYKKEDQVDAPNDVKSEKVYEFSNAPKTTNIRSIMQVSKKSLGDRLAKEGAVVVSGIGGNREMKFSMRDKKKPSEIQKKMKKHHEERKQLVRRTGYLNKKRLPKM